MIEPLARQYTVVAPDLPGHGGSAPGAGDYSLGALAAGLRDLLVALGHERATLVGHSLGGGIAMQFTYQFPEITERLVLVSSGGLGPEVSAILRAAALPGAVQFIAVTAALGNTDRHQGRARAGDLRPASQHRRRGDRTRLRFARRPRPPNGVPRHAARRRRQGWAAGPRRRPALPCRGHARPDHLGRARSDHPRPARQNAHEAMPGSHLEIFEGVGHLPQLEAPGHFIALLERFITENEPARFDVQQWRGRLRDASGQP